MLAAVLAAVPATAGVGGPLAAAAGRADRGGMTGNARFAALPEGDDGAGAGGPANAAAGAGWDGCDGCGRCGASPRAWVGPAPVVPVEVRAGDHARPGPDDMPPPRPAPENAGNRVATAMSRGANPLTVAPGRALGNRRTTGEDGDDAAAYCCAAAECWVAAVCWVAALLPAAAAAVAGAGATERIGADDAGLTTAVDRSSRELPAARSSAGRCGAGVADGCE